MFWTFNCLGTIGSDCSRLGIEVANSTTAVPVQGEIDWTCHLFILYFSRLLLSNLQGVFYLRELTLKELVKNLKNFKSLVLYKSL